MTTLGDGSSYGLEISYSHEELPLSTVGPISLIKDLPEHFLVVNGDILTELDFKKLYDFHLANKVLVTVATCQRTVTNDYGTLETDPTGLVTAFHEKPTYSFTVSTGIYVFSREVLNYIPTGQRFGFDDLMHTLLENKQPIATYPFDGYWQDIGRIDDYEQANSDTEIIRRLLE
jgi:NDP-sugar pyrophosphorylase family protein